MVGWLRFIVVRICGWSVWLPSKCCVRYTVPIRSLSHVSSVRRKRHRHSSTPTLSRFMTTVKPKATTSLSWNSSREPTCAAIYARAGCWLWIAPSSLLTMSLWDWEWRTGEASFTATLNHKTSWLAVTAPSSSPTSGLPVSIDAHGPHSLRWRYARRRRYAAYPGFTSTP